MGVDAGQAFTVLRTASQTTNIKLREVAAAVVAELPAIGAPQDLDALRDCLDRVLFGT